jgi:hypothetical protein
VVLSTVCFLTTFRVFFLRARAGWRFLLTCIRDSTLPYFGRPTEDGLNSDA